MIVAPWPDGDYPAFMFWAPPQPDDTVFTWHPDDCAMCGKSRSETRQTMHLDHDHNSFLIRGYLCMQCNIHEPLRQEPAFDAWRAGMNPCAMFSWDYRRQDSQYKFRVSQEQRNWLAHKSVLADGMWGRFHEPGASPFI